MDEQITIDLAAHERRAVHTAQIPRLMTIPDAAQRLAVRESWLREQVASRTVPFTRLPGGMVRFSDADLAAICDREGTPA